MMLSVPGPWVAAEGGRRRRTGTKRTEGNQKGGIGERGPARPHTGISREMKVKVERQGG